MYDTLLQVVDVSGSMGGVVEQLQTAVKHVGRSVNPNDRVAVVCTR